MVLVGRYTCVAQGPKCAECPFLDLCPRKGVSEPRPEAKPRKTPRPVKGGRKPAAEAAPAATAAPATTAAATAATTAPAPAAAGPAIDPWIPVLVGEVDQPYFLQLLDFVERERAQHSVFPPADQVFSAFTLTPFDRVKVVVLGQDPYHDDGQAHGLAFSVAPDVAIPPSLRNIHTELRSDLGIEPPSHGHLAAWARQGVMLLNTVLTVRAHEPNSHRQKGWERFTDAAIRALSRQRDHVVFVLWGKPAQKKAKLIDARKHTVLEANHPSPLSARKGFFGSKPFSRINAALEKHGQSPIDWRL
ncbi:MAG: uracil-DNA glycosylase [Myxococcales bacterium]|nr:uracil-DNA glycosylase [Myxococcales bacterium]